MEDSDDCIVIGEGTNGCCSSTSSATSTSLHQHPSRLAEILAHKVKIKQEKIHSASHAMMYMPPSAAAAAASSSLFLGPHNHATMNMNGVTATNLHTMMNPQEADLVPKSSQDFQIVSQLRQMGFNNNDREIMVALRAIEKKRNHASKSINGINGINGTMDANLINSFIDDVMLYIVVSSKVNSKGGVAPVRYGVVEHITYHYFKCHGDIETLYHFDTVLFLNIFYLFMFPTIDST